LKRKPQLNQRLINYYGLWVLAPKIISDKFAEDRKKELITAGIIELLTVLILWIWNKFQSFSYQLFFVLQTTSIVVMVSGRLFV
jgi:hypothetical protein